MNPLKAEYITTVTQCFINTKNRSSFINLVFSDYSKYNLDYMNPGDLERRTIRVCLPEQIYMNVLIIFKVFLDKLLVDILN